jgi:hypothetical protein
MLAQRPRPHTKVTGGKPDENTPRGRPPPSGRGVATAALLYTLIHRSAANFVFTEFSEVPGSRLYRILAPALDIVGKGDPGMPTRLVDRDPRGWKARVREGPDGDDDLMFVAFLDVVDR